MIVIAGHLVIRPDAREAAEVALLALAEQTTAEKGNLDYRFGTDIRDPTRVNLFERWESEEALTQHMGSEHMAAFIGSAGDFMGGAPQLVRYDVSGSSPLF
ncbi:MAG: antibiotic biosynthesis monooxygenase [Acidimicrobiales bacterium]|nr:antibiotic biosynthesis monooxygenase [Acidimicrobiales bacterium]